MSANKETLGKTLTVVVAVCLVCSIVVSGAAVGLRDMQKANALLDKQTKILAAAGLLEDAAGDVPAFYASRIEEKFVELSSGNYVEKPAGFEIYDQYKAARSDAYGTVPENDVAKILRKPLVASVYLSKDETGNVDKVILPINGSGLWGVMYAFMSIEKDGNTVSELVYYEHKETPGLGAEITNPNWMAKWPGKKLFSADGKVAVNVRKGVIAEGDQHAVDALSGATLTSNGVRNSLQFWLGEEGFGPFLAKRPWS